MFVLVPEASHSFAGCVICGRMGVVLFCGVAAVPVVLIMIRKYIERQWGHYEGTECLQNKIFLVTGATSGLGKATVTELASRKARVIMACRDLNKAKQAITDIRANVKTGELIPMELDLASLQSVRKFADEVKRDFPRIHVLINNAGVSIPIDKEMVTEDGFEINLGVNHLGHFLLTNLLLDLLKTSRPSRIVTVSSKLHESGEINLETLSCPKFPVSLEKSRVRNPAYNRSKLANVYFTRELAARLDPTDEVQAFAVCPGLCYTNLFRHAELKPLQIIGFSLIAFFFMRTPTQGCQTILHCSLSDDLSGYSGEVFRDCKPYRSSHKFSPEIQKKLWEVSSQMVGL